MSNHSIIAYALRKVGPMSTSELAKELGMAVQPLRQCLWRARNVGKCHVVGWRVENGRQVEVHAYGPGIDAPRPARKKDPRAQKPRIVTTAAPIEVPENLAASAGNPFSVAMWNVAQGARNAV